MSVVNVCVLVLDRFIAIVHPLKYITFMTCRHITQVTFFSWTTTAGFEVLQFSRRVTLKTRLVDAIFCWLDVIFLEFLPSTIMVFSFVSIGTLSIDDEMGRRRRPEVKFSRANLLGMR